MNTFEITIQRKSSEESWPVVAELKQPSVPSLRSEGTFQLTETDLNELYSLGNSKEYGTFLGEKLFQGKVRDAFVGAWVKSSGDENSEGLRILLFIEAKDIISTLRWERLCAPKDGQWSLLRLDQNLPFSLYIPSSISRRFSPIGKRDLHALVLAASPQNLFDEYQLGAFDVEKAVAGVREALGEIPYDVLAPNSEKIPKVIGPPTLDELCRQLTDRRKQYTLLHFICHGRFLYGDTNLYLANAENQVEVISGQELIKRLRYLHNLPRFAFLSTCESASSEAEGGLGGLGQRLVRDLGMPAVIAMTEKVTVKTALELGQCFYQQLRESGYVDLALTEATAGLMDRNDITVPALFSRLGGLPLFSDNLNRDLTNTEIEFGLNRLQDLLPERAPILQKVFEQADKTLRTTLGSEIGRKTALEKVNELCGEILDLSFNALALDKQLPTYDSRCPFMGLRPFKEENREFFFGREQLIEKLEQKLLKHPFLAVLGPSGSGKSSIVFAGLVPKLQSQESGLHIASFRPGIEPLAKLEAAKVVDKLTIFVIDQFEELFTLCNEDEQRQQFIAAMLALSQQQRVIITMRADFWGECASYENLKDEMEAWQVLIGSMNTAELRSAMDQQAALVRISFEAHLSNAILDDVSGEPGAMPLLQHGLWELWKRRHGQWLKAEEYHDGIGGVKKSIAKTADDFYKQLSSLPEPEKSEFKNIFKNIFIRLTRLDESVVQGEGGRDTRRRVDLEELVPLGSELSATKKLVKHLADARLVVTSEDTITHRKEVEVAHEALIRYWPRLANWLDENRTNLQLRETIRQSALKWEENQKQEDDLVLKGGRLDDAKVLARQAGFLNQLEAGYVKACVALTEAAEKVIARRQWRIFASLTAGLVIAFILVSLAVWQWNKAEKQTQIALTEKEKAKDAQIKAETEKIRANKEKEAAKEQTNAALKTQSLFLANLSRQQTEESRSVEGILLALEGLPKDMSEKDRPYVNEAEKKLYSAVLHHSEKMSEHLVLEGNSAIIHVAFSPDGKIIVAIGENIIRLWQVENGKLLHSFKGYNAVFSPDGKLVVTSSRDNARLWQVENGKLLHILKGHVGNAAFSPNGKLVVTSSGDKTARLWQVETGKILHIFKGYNAAFSPDGKLVVTTDDKTARLWQVENGKLLHTLKGHEDYIRNAAFSPDGKLVVTSSDDKTVRLWHVENGKLLHTFKWHEKYIRNAAFSPDGKLVTILFERTAMLWQVENGKPLHTLKGHEGYIMNATFSPDGKLVVTASWDKTAKLWQVENGKPLHILKGHKSLVMNAAFSPDGKLVVTGSLDQTVRLWQVENGKSLYTLKRHEDYVDNSVFSPDGKLVVTSLSDKTARLWQVENGKLLHTLKGHKDGVNNAAFNPDGKLVVTSGSYDKTAMLWQVENGKLLHTLKGHESLVNNAAFSPDGKLVVTRDGYDKTARLWQVENGKLLHTLKGHKAYVNNAAFSPDSKLVVTSSSDKTAMLWQVENGKLLHTLKGHEDYIRNAAFSPDGKLVVTSSNDKTARLWQVENGKLLHTLKGHEDWVKNAAFSPDGKLVVTSGTDDKTAMLWQVENGKLLHILKGHKSFVNNTAFSPDGKLVVTSSLDKTTRLWKVFSTQELIDYANKIVPRCLTNQQRQRFFLTESNSNNLVTEGENLARAGKIKEAIAKFKQAKKLTPCFKFDPEDKAKRVASTAIFEQGEKLAEEGKIPEAVDKFGHAMQIDSRIKLAEPEEYAQRLLKQAKNER